MVAGLVDHLWQSVCFFALTSGAVFAVRQHSARWRLWMWRIAALKFALPFWLLCTLGAWLGFPVVHAGDLPPPALRDAFALATPIAAPVASAQVSGLALAASLAVMLLATLTCLRTIVAGLHVERWRARDEAERLERDPDDGPSHPGLVTSALLTAICLIIAAAPVTAGAVDDRLHRHELLIANAMSLRTARIAMSVAAPGMGDRSRVIVRAEGVLIRNTNIQGLLALAYGVSPYSVRWLDQMFPEDSAPEEKYWLQLPRYDVRVTAPIPAPEEFDTYALHQIVTKLLADRFGLEVYVKQQCQAPCGHYNVPLPEVE